MGQAWHPDDTGWRDARMAEAARRTRAYRKPQPIADARTPERNEEADDGSNQTD